MEVKIGIVNVAREVVIETTESADEVSARLAAALASGDVFKLSDAKGRVILVPPAALAYVDLGSENVRPVGFGAI